MGGSYLPEVSRWQWWAGPLALSALSALGPLGGRYQVKQPWGELPGMLCAPHTLGKPTIPPLNA